MILISLLLLSFAIFLLVFKANNLYSVVFTTTLISLFLLLLFSVVYIERVSLYSYVFSVEKPLLNTFKIFNISIFKLRNFVYGSISIYFFSMFIAIVKSLPQVKALKLGIFAGLIVCSLLYLNSSSFTETLYIWATSASRHFINRYAKEIFSSISLLNKNIFVFISVIPYILFYLKYKNHQLFYKKRQIVYFSVLLFTLQIFIVTIISGPLKFYFFSSNLLDLYAPPAIVQNTNYYFILSIYTIIIIIFTAFVITQYKIFDEIDFFKDIKSKKTVKLESDDIKHIFHSFKNNLIVLDMINQSSLNDLDNQEAIVSNLQQTQTYINDMYDHTVRFLNLYKKQNTSKETIILDSTVKSAIHHLKIPNNITVSIDIQDELIKIFTDKLLFTEAIINIIQNAFEAIGSSPDGKVVIKLWTESNFGCLSVKDNGCGIEKKYLKKIYKPLFSTKKTHTNWGLGLSYTRKIIHSSYGFINVQSKPNRGTEVQIAIPLE